FVGAALVVVVGVGGSILAAREVALDDQGKSTQALVTSSADVELHLRLAIQRENDLLVSASAFMATHPTASNSHFNEWVRAERAFARYPELVALGRIQIVDASDLARWAANARRSAPDGSFRVIPPGRHPFYCFVDLATTPPSGTPAVPAGANLCADPGLAAAAIAARDSGRGTYAPFTVGPTVALGVQLPIYRGGGVPNTVAGRRAAFIGILGNSLKPHVILRTALDGRTGLAVRLRYGQGPSAVTYAIGKASRDARSLTVDLHNGWTIRTSGHVDTASIVSNANALGILGGGISVSLLLGLLLVALTAGRARALRLVGAQTVELTAQAAALRATVGKLELAHSAKDEFIALVSHELRTPLTSIRGYAELLYDGQLDEAQRTYLDVIDRNSTRLLGLVEDLLLMAQIQSGDLPLDKGLIVLNDLIARSSENARPFAASKEIALGIDAEPNVATHGDSARIGQVIDNLVSNAIKYTPNGGDVSITMTSDAGIATIAVADTGIGIPQDEANQLFGRFFRTSNARESGIQGSGLGLAISRGIVEAHGGTIGFESVEGAGTTFRITLPVTHDAGLASAA
ncbi:MAG: hypothetical protein QOK22_98, partial [Gaiellaceae bacterium]|nr:hypothetical protein [Gaiellaceae bacterium]